MPVGSHQSIPSYRLRSSSVSPQTQIPSNRSIRARNPSGVNYAFLNGTSGRSSMGGGNMPIFSPVRAGLSGRIGTGNGSSRIRTGQIPDDDVSISTDYSVKTSTTIGSPPLPPNQENIYPIERIPNEQNALRVFLLNCPFTKYIEKNWFRFIIRRTNHGSKQIYECGVTKTGEEFYILCYAIKISKFTSTYFEISINLDDLLSNKPSFTSTIATSLSSTFRINSNNVLTDTVNNRANNSDSNISLNGSSPHNSLTAYSLLPNRKNKKSDGFLGRLNMNFKKNNFVLVSISSECEDFQIDQAIICYIDKSGSQYSYQVCLPCMQSNGKYIQFISSSKDKSQLQVLFNEIVKTGAQNVMYVDKVKCFALTNKPKGRLDQYGVVIEDSVKNCALYKCEPQVLTLRMGFYNGGVKDKSYEQNPFRMGKLYENTYMVDFNYPFSFYQALGVALTRFM